KRVSAKFHSLIAAPYSLFATRFFLRLEARPASEHFLRTAEVLVERGHRLCEAAFVVAAPSRARLADDDAEPLRARLPGHAVRFEARERKHPARAAHMPLVHGREQCRIAVDARF